MQNETQLISQLKNKDEQALALLYDKYSGAIYSVIIKMTHNEMISQELLQETFMAVWEKSDQYKSEKGRFYTWIYRIARNKVLNHLRKTDKLIQMDDLGVYTNKEETVNVDPEYLELNGAVSKLETHHKQAIELVYFKGLTHREAHQEMEVPLGTFKSYVRQALIKLRASYDKTLTLLLVLMDVM